MPLYLGRRVPLLALIALIALIAAPPGLPGLGAQEGGAGVPVLPSTFRHDIRPGAGVTRIGTLSDYEPSLRGGPGDGLVFHLESGRPGPALLVLSGTHANELAGILASTMVVERARALEGRIIVVPYANNSGSSWRDPVKPRPEWLAIPGREGPRLLRVGSRYVHPAHQGLPDPAEYRRPEGGESLPGMESRNVNRAYPGLREGGLAQRVALAIMTLVLSEKVGLAVDLHESSPGSNLAWVLVCNPKNVDLGALAVLDLEDRGISMHLDKSAESDRGLSHREWGDWSAALAFLVETPNPGQAADSVGEVDQVGDPEYPLWRRVGTQLEVLSALVSNFNASRGGPAIRYAGLPTYAELAAKGLGAFY